MTRLLVDGNGVAIRAWWANANGCVDRFKAAVERAKPSTGADVIVCWDSPNSWRRDLFPAYKANRGPKPSALIQALLDCRATCHGLVADGFEADDLIATLAHKAGDGEVVLILSDDKDLLQLVSRPWTLVVESSGKVHDDATATIKLGVPPHKIRHLLSWMGDKVDGLPGVPGFGPKRARVKALAGEIGNPLTFELTELATVPQELMRAEGGDALASDNRSGQSGNE